MALVIDNSMLAAWYMPDEDEPLADSAVEAVLTSHGLVPQIWWHEFHNTLVSNLRRRRIRHAEADFIREEVLTLDLREQPRPESRDVMSLAGRFELSFYDASYLDLSLKASLRLATLDRRLIAAAPLAGVALFDPHADPADSKDDNA